ncbi:hypothetical protein IJG72_01325 [bacterium]|nr:hypothetical protein [bacterium]
MNVSAIGNNIPSSTVLDGNNIKNRNVTFSGVNLGPTWQKGLKFLSNMSTTKQTIILMIPGLTINPAIDLFNKKVDDETRKFSACRSIAKELAGSSIGVGVRALCGMGCEKLLKKGHLFGKMLDKNAKDYLKQLKEHAGIVGGISALGALLFTDFFVDIPFINFTNELLVKLFFPKYAKNNKPENLKQPIDDKKIQEPKENKVVLDLKKDVS